MTNKYWNKINGKETQQPQDLQALFFFIKHKKNAATRSSSL